MRGKPDGDGREEQHEDDEASEEKASPVMGPGDTVDQRPSLTADRQTTTSTVAARRGGSFPPARRCRGLLVRYFYTDPGACQSSCLLASATANI